MKHYYACRWEYGRACGRQEIYRFRSAMERDDWADSGPAYQTDPGYREAVTARQIEYQLRRVRRRPADDDLLYWRDDYDGRWADPNPWQILVEI